MSAELDVLFAVEGGTDAGLGHVTRCLALAEEAAARGLAAGFALRGDDAARELLEATAAPVKTWADPASVARAARWVLFDGRGAIADDVTAVRRDGGRSLVLDRTDCIDLADWTVLPVAHAAPLPHPRVRQGPAYCVIARELRALRSAMRGPLPERMLVTLGGADPRAATARVAEVLASQPQCPDVALIDVVVGPAFAAAPGLARRLAADGFCVHRAPSRRALGVLALGARFAICGFGTTVYDLAYLGTPMLYLTHHAADLDDAARLERAGIGASAGFAGELDAVRLRERLANTAFDPRWRAGCSARGTALLGDGEGAARIVGLIGADATPQQVAC